MSEPFRIVSKTIGSDLTIAVLRDLNEAGYKVTRKRRTPPRHLDRAELAKKYQKGCDTSQAAAELMEAHKVPMKDQIYVILLREGPKTCHELVSLMRSKIQTVSARLNDLQETGEIVDSGERRPARTGGRTRAVVWSAMPAETPALRLVS